MDYWLLTLFLFDRESSFKIQHYIITLTSLVTFNIQKAFFIHG